MERAEQMRSFTKGIWVAIHFQFIRNILLALPRWVLAFLSGAWVQVLWVSNIRIFHFSGMYVLISANDIDYASS